MTRAAVELDESPATRGTLLSALLRAPAAIGVVNHGWPIYGAALSPDGRLMATGDERGDVTVYDAATRRPLGPPYRIEGRASSRTFASRRTAERLRSARWTRGTPTTTGSST